MKILWTASNWKRTGPVQPSLDLAAGVAGLGHEVRVAVGRPPRDEEPEADRMCAARGLVAANTDARLHKHAFFLRDRPEVRRLATWLDRERPEAVVSTLPNDHRLVLAALRRFPGIRGVRLWFSDGAGEIPPREVRSLVAADCVVAFGKAPARRLVELGLPEEKICVLAPPLDVRGLRRRLEDPRASETSSFALSGRFVFGIVARIQTHRRFERLWDAVAALDARHVPFHVVVLGRGTNRERVGFRPVRDRGLTGRVTFAGYLRGPAYAKAVSDFDAQILLVPGSDPTCRALREGMALGVPSIATKRGLLPSIVADGETGVLVDETSDALADAMERWARDPVPPKRMGEAAARWADRYFDAGRVARGLIERL